MSLPDWTINLMDEEDVSAPVFLQGLYRHAAGRLPDEYETSYFLHRLLMEGDSRQEVATQVLRSDGYPLLSDEGQFVVDAYRRVTGRDPSAEELSSGEAIVRTGSLGFVAFCQELGEPLPEWNVKMPRSPRMSDVLALDGEPFVWAAYRCVVGRLPSASELRSLLARLPDESKAVLLHEIGGPPPGRMHGWFRVPWIGRFLHVLALVWHLPSIEREIIVLRHRCAELEASCRKTAGKRRV
jgi:hypothetical protein